MDDALPKGGVQLVGCLTLCTERKGCRGLSTLIIKCLGPVFQGHLCESGNKQRQLGMPWLPCFHRLAALQSRHSYNSSSLESPNIDIKCHNLESTFTSSLIYKATAINVHTKLTRVSPKLRSQWTWLLVAWWYSYRDRLLPYGPGYPLSLPRKCNRLL